MKDKLLYHVKNTNGIKGNLYEQIVERGGGLISSPVTYYKVKYGLEEEKEEYVEQMSPGTFVTHTTKKNIWNII